MLLRVPMLLLWVPFRLLRVRITVFIQDPSGHAIADRLSKHVVSETSQVPRNLTQSRCRCGQGEPRSGADVARGERSPGADVADDIPTRSATHNIHQTPYTMHHAPCSRECAGPVGAEARDDRQHDSCYAPHRPQRRKLSLAHRTCAHSTLTRARTRARTRTHDENSPCARTVRGCTALNARGLSRRFDVHFHRSPRGHAERTMHSHRAHPPRIRAHEQTPRARTCRSS